MSDNGQRVEGLAEVKGFIPREDNGQLRPVCWVEISEPAQPSLLVRAIFWTMLAGLLGYCWVKIIGLL